VKEIIEENVGNVKESLKDTTALVTSKLDK
jgi:hypothetical protein